MTDYIGMGDLIYMEGEKCTVLLSSLFYNMCSIVQKT